MPRATRTIKKELLQEQPVTDLPTPASIQSGTAKSTNDYIEIRLPKFRFQDSPLSPLWVILLVVFAFLLGMTTTKIQYLQQGNTTNNVQAARTQPENGQPQEPTVEDLKVWAKDLKLNTNTFNQCLADEKFKDRIDKDVADAIAASAEATPTFYVNGTRVVGALPYEQFKVTLDNALNGTDTGEKITVAPGGLPMLGKDDAPVTMIEFSDLQCPFCLRFFQNSFPQIKKNYIDTGKVKFYFRHLPLTQLHPMAMPFANAAECANEQNKFWEMHDKIYNEQA
ncbi:MAG: thioredoxin domain-containing protein [Candidatus Levybacteria bacterium]|nr:thioredoxin domain-containing protein [Candidatus Levybacteria bacterium]